MSKKQYTRTPSRRKMDLSLLLVEKLVSLQRRIIRELMNIRHHDRQLSKEKAYLHIDFLVTYILRNIYKGMQCLLESMVKIGSIPRI